MAVVASATSDAGPCLDTKRAASCGAFFFLPAALPWSAPRGTITAMDRDIVQRFLFEEAPVRGEMVHLDATWSALLEHQSYPEPVRDLLGQMLAAGALLAATIKFDGRLTLQIQGDGPVGLAVVDVTAARTVRGMAHWEGEPEGHDLGGLVGDGRLAITIDPGHGQRYQGIVPLERATLAEAIDDYLERSEQLPTRMWLAADGERAAGMLLQRLPAEAERDEDAWNRAVILAETLTGEELRALTVPEVVRRLFHEEDIRLFEPHVVSFRCSCSRERVAETLRGLGQEEMQSILTEQGRVEVHCEFCNRRYEFDTVDVEQLFAGDTQHGLGPTRH